MADDARREKLARNEYLIKQMNRRIDRLTAEFAADDLVPGDDKARFFCACGSPECEARLTLTLAEYERVRAMPDRFILCPGHEHPAVERVVEEHPSYVLVEKLPEYRLSE